MQVISTDIIEPYQVDFEKLNGDEIPDLIVSSYTDDVVGSFVNLGNGEFGSLSIYVDDAYSCLDFEVADLDNDQDLDLVYASASGYVYWYENEGDYDFGDKAEIYATEYGSGGISVSDVDNNGYMDVIWVSSQLDETVCMKNDGDGSFSIQHLGHRQGTERLELSDLDGDGDDDLIMFQYGLPVAEWVENHGDGEFGIPERIYPPNLGWAGGDRAAMGDLDGDGDIDIVLQKNDPQNSFDKIIVWLQNNGNAEFTLTDLDPIGDDTVFSGFFIADLNGDGDNDVVTYSGGAALAYENNGNGEFNSSYYNIPSESSYSDMWVNDLDSDGLPDLIVNAHGWQKNLGNGQFTAWQSLGDDFDNYSIQDIAIGDLDNDSDKDIVIITESSGYNFWILENNGEEFFTETAITTGGPPNGDIEIHDMDCDGDNDIVLTKGDLVYAVNDGSGEFETIVTMYELDDGQYQMKFSDLDLDGFTDIVFGNAWATIWSKSLEGYGCTDMEACNFNEKYVFEDESCFYPPCYNLGDYNGDGQINTTDLLELLGSLGCTGEDCPGDLNGDLVVNILDLLIMLGWMGITYP
jgi:hypothetical protein